MPGLVPGIFFVPGFCLSPSWLTIALCTKCGRKGAGDKKIERPFD
jgi:hypothetical protein